VGWFLLPQRDLSQIEWGIATTPVPGSSYYLNRSQITPGIAAFAMGPLAAKARPQHQQLIGIVEGGCAWHRWRQRMIPLNGLLGLVPWHHRPYQPDQRQQDEGRTNSRKEQSNFSLHVPPSPPRLSSPQWVAH
jgi:hypothetical protein